ncbi:hypothetical protein V8E36_005602 [Tilletia maclaganii]
MSSIGGGWTGPGPGGGGGNPAVLLTSALAARTLIRSKAINKLTTSTKTNATRISTTAKAPASTAGGLIRGASVRNAAQRPASAAARNALLNHVPASSFSTSSKAASASAAASSSKDKQSSLDAFLASFAPLWATAGRVVPPLAEEAETAVPRTFNAARHFYTTSTTASPTDRVVASKLTTLSANRARVNFAGSATGFGGASCAGGPMRMTTPRVRLPINQTTLVHGPGLHLARNFSSAGAGGGAGGNAYQAVQENVAPLLRMLADEEERKRRAGMLAGGKGATISPRAAAASRRSNKAKKASNRRPTRASGVARASTSVATDRLSAVDGTLTKSVSLNYEAEYEHFFATAITTEEPTIEATEAQQNKGEHAPSSWFEEEQLLLINEMRHRLLEEPGPHAPHISTRLTLLDDEALDPDFVRLLLRPERPPHAQLRRKPAMATVSSSIEPTTNGGFLDDVHRAAAVASLEVEDHSIPTEPHDYNKSVRTFIAVHRALRSVLSPNPETLVLSQTIRLSHPRASDRLGLVAATDYHFQGHALADVAQLLHLMLDLQAQVDASSPRVSSKVRQFSSADLDLVFDSPLLREMGFVGSVMGNAGREDDGMSATSHGGEDSPTERTQMMEELSFRPTVPLSTDSDAPPTMFGSPSLQFDFPLAPHSARSASSSSSGEEDSIRPSSSFESWAYEAMEVDEAEEVEVESLLLLRSPSLSSGSSPPASVPGQGDDGQGRIQADEEEQEENDEGRWLYDSRMFLSNH